MRREVDNLETLARIRKLGTEGAADLEQHGYMLIELPEWIAKLLNPYTVDRYLNEVGGPSGTASLNGKRLRARAEPLDNTRRFDEAAGGLATVARLVATALLAHRQNILLTPSAISVLQPVDGAYAHASVAHINIYSRGEDVGDNTGQPSAYSPHTDGGLLTLVTCPVSDRTLVVQRPGGAGAGRSGGAAGGGAGEGPAPRRAAPRFAPPYRATRHHVHRGMVAGERASVTFHLRPHPDALLSDMQTAGEFLERFYGGVQRINAQRIAAKQPPASAAASAAAAPASTLSRAAAPSTIVLEVYILAGSVQQRVEVKVGLWQNVATVLKWCAGQAKVPVEELRAVIDGVCLDPDRSFQFYGIEEGDVIDIRKQQIGD